MSKDYEDRVLFIATGGTIDAQVYKNTPKDITPLDKSIIPYVLSGDLEWDNYDFLPWKARDSKKFSLLELRNLAEIVRHANQDHIVVTHGTDWMPQNVRAFMRFLGEADKVVIFTGAMTPLAEGKKSDGYKNLKFIQKNIFNEEPGVYLVMHGKYINPARAKKDIKGKQIYEVDDKDMKLVFRDDDRRR